MAEKWTIKNGRAKNRLVRTISVFGLTESAAFEKLTQFKQLFPQFKLEIESAFPEIRLKLFAGQPDVDGIEESLGTGIRWVRQKLGSHVYSDAGRSMEQVVGALLSEKNATLAVAESCTGGLIANLLTDVPGSSDYFLFSAVTYANQAKMRILDVRGDTLERYGAVSEQTAREMARGAKKVVDATYGLATSGIAGPGGGTDDKPVGTVCIGLATALSARGHRFNYTGCNRRANKHIFAITALDLLRKELLGVEATNLSTS
jgi:nicotinamide-nucleotide amidase